MTDCTCGHSKDLHFQDGCLSKAGGGYFCACMEYEPAETTEQATARMFTEAQAWADLPEITVSREIARDYYDEILQNWRDAGLLTEGIPAKRVEGWGEFKTTTPEPPRDHWMKRLFLRGR